MNARMNATRRIATLAILAMTGLLCHCAGEFETNDEGHDHVHSQADGDGSLAFTTQGKTVRDMVWQACSTSSVRGLSQQLIDEIECMSPGTMKRIPDHPNLRLGDAVFPYMQKGAADALEAALKSRSGTMSINSALRTLPQQFLLYQWYRNGQRCGIRLAASPGRSNHESGLAIDISEYSAWRSTLQNKGFRWLGGNDPVHFDYTGSSVNLSSKSVLAFQRLWNRNNPHDPISEDGVYGNQTAARLMLTPADGFASGASCSGAPSNPSSPSNPTAPSDPGTPQQGEAMEVYWAQSDDGSYRLRALAPEAVASVSYHVDGYTIGQSSRDDGANFPESYTFSNDGEGRAFSVRGYDRNGTVVASGRGSIDVGAGPGVFIRQLGEAYYSVGLERAPASVAHIEVEADGWPVGSGMASGVYEVRHVFSQTGVRTFTIRALDADGNLVQRFERTFDVQ